MWGLCFPIPSPAVFPSVGIMIEAGRGGWKPESSAGRAAHPADIN